MPSLHNSDEEAPCRSCTSFSEYMKQNKKKYLAEQGKSKEKTEAVPARDDCPLDREQLGRSTWGFLHTMAARYPKKPSKEQEKDMKEFIRIFSNFYPCDVCAADFREDLKSVPVETSSQDTFSKWMCDIHNRVNKKLGKNEFDCSKVNERWKTGWLDGSCG